ncbi:MAG TPA: glycoside hydrolase family 3 N-terminal domain-containing protein, partial [Prolixibacteraceae bacterium]|nr:glycoside hydrolase family 3 N-terminal domain-containing protein [Prolixibacteraceae bacterium]
MNKVRIIAALILFSFSVFFLSCEKDDPVNPTLEEQIGQMLLVGFRGTEIKESEHIVRDLEDYNLGGVILYEKDGPSQSRPRNIDSPGQLYTLIKELKTHSREKLLVAIDQEGGVVDRLKASYGFPTSVSAQYLGECNNADTTRARAATLATTLQAMGI